MNRKEISEIKKQFRPENCSITRVCGCYTDGEGNRVTTFSESFLTLPEEEIHKYLEIFRKALSGPLGKNLINMEFPLDTEMEGGTQHALLALRNSALKDEALVDRFFDNIQFEGNHLAILIHAAYDVPGKGSDELEQFDASDETYSFILFCICPVSLAKQYVSDLQREGYRKIITYGISFCQKKCRVE